MCLIHDSFRAADQPGNICPGCSDILPNLLPAYFLLDTFRFYVQFYIVQQYIFLPLLQVKHLHYQFKISYHITAHFSSLKRVTVAETIEELESAENISGEARL